MHIFRVQVRYCACNGSKMGAYILSGGIETSPKARQWKLYVYQISFVACICFWYDLSYSYNTNTSMTILNKTNWLSLCDSAFWRCKCNKCKFNTRKVTAINLSFHSRLFMPHIKSSHSEVALCLVH